MKFLILTIIATFAVSAHASLGQEGGGGGLGIEHQGKIYLYDFLEAGIEENPYIDTSLPDRMNASQGVQNTMAAPEVQRLIVNKLNEIYLLAPEAAFRLLEVFKTYQWRYVLPKVKETKDRGYTPVNVANKELQIAYRDDAFKVVTIDREYLKRMSLAHQAGLYFHEILYALTLADCDFRHDCRRHLESYFDGKPLWGDQYKTAYRARMFTSYLFHPSFKGQNTASFTAFYNSTINTESQDKSGFVKDDFISYSVYEFLKSPQFIVQCNALKSELNDVLLQGGIAFQTMESAVRKAKATKKCNQEYRFNDQDYITKRILNGTSYSFPYSDLDHAHAKYRGEVFKAQEFVVYSSSVTCNQKKISFDKDGIRNAAQKFNQIKNKNRNTFQQRCITDETLINLIETYAALQIAD